MEKVIDCFGDLKENGKQNVLIFFTDGMPTYPDGSVTIGYYITLKDGNEEISSMFLSEYIESGLDIHGDKVWGNVAGSVPILATSIKNDYNARIYCINFGETKAEYGLKNLVSSWTETETYYYAYAGTESDIEKAFDSVGESMEPINISDINPKSYGTIQLEKVSKIKKIRVGTNEYDFTMFGVVGDENDNGILNLNDFPTIFHRQGDITVVY